jgi:hypothetical protein
MTQSPITPPMAKLVPFPLPADALAGNIEIWVNAEVIEQNLHLRFRLEAKSPAEFAEIKIPVSTNRAQRKKDLWKETCFECFIPAPQSNAYVEFNGSPSGDWNLFAFQTYRDRAVEFELNAELQPKQSVINRRDGHLESAWSIPLAAIHRGFLSVGAQSAGFERIGITLVLKVGEECTYWALKHDGGKPDFHLASSFIYPIQS